MRTTGLSQKVYLEMTPPTEADNVSYQERILRELRSRELAAELSIPVLRKLYPLCPGADWKVTLSLCWNGQKWEAVAIEEGNTVSRHFGLAVDLGSTSVIVRLIDCERGEVLAEEGVYNQQIRFGEDILTRIFYAKDNPAHLEEIRQATLATFHGIFEKIRHDKGIDPENCLSMVVAGNTTMIHFLLGLDAFCVFQSPYAVRADRPGFFRGKDLDIPIAGYVYCFPSRANYLGGDILSGLIATGFYKEKDISLFFDVGTNGELVIGNQDFLLCGAGAAGPALEGGSVKTGMRAAAGAVESVRIVDGNFQVETIGNTKPVGICGSGIVDLLSELFIHGWVNIQGTLQPDKSDRIRKRKNAEADEEELAVCYADGLWFYQSDIREFISTKAAAATMIEYMLKETGIGLSDVAKFYMAGSFGAHVNIESAVNIGMYPDVPRDRLLAVGNTSLEGAEKLLLDKSYLADLDHILELMSYVQFGAVDNFVEMMQAASALPHTDTSRYPSVMQKLRTEASREDS